MARSARDAACPADGRRARARLVWIGGLWALASSAACGGPRASSTGEQPSPPTGGPAIVQAGAPGQAARAFDTGTLSEIGGVAHTAADVRFMRGMIPHHAQALEMTALVPSRAATDAFRGMALRMQISQRDEIALMTNWLSERGEDVPPVDAHRMMLSGAMPPMPGMLTEQQMAELSAASGEHFERLFLEFMIIHHEGAIAMVQELFGSSRAGEETLVFWFASEVDSDQSIEIQRMRQMLAARR